MEQLTTFVSDNLLLFGALLVVLVLLIRAELDHQLNKGLLLSPSAAVRLINNSSDAIIIDTRSTAEFKKGHIKGAKNLPLANFGDKLGELGQQKDCPVLVYCNSGATATKAIRALKNAGFEKVNNLEGGILAWQEAKLPVSK